MRNKKHPTEKPIELMRILVENSTNENEVVLDPFMGVGGVGVVCKQTNREFIGIEIDEKYYNIALERISEKEVFKTDEADQINGQIKLWSLGEETENE